MQLHLLQHPSPLLRLSWLKIQLRLMKMATRWAPKYSARDKASRTCSIAMHS